MIARNHFTIESERYMLRLSRFDWVLLAVLSLCVCTARAGGEVLSASDKLNIVYIIADDQGWGDASMLGERAFKKVY